MQVCNKKRDLIIQNCLISEFLKAKVKTRDKQSQVLGSDVQRLYSLRFRQQAQRKDTRREEPETENKTDRQTEVAIKISIFKAPFATLHYITRCV